VGKGDKPQDWIKLGDGTIIQLIQSISTMIVSGERHHIIGLVAGARLESRYEAVARIAPIQYKVKYGW
jgi:hypothetical protein